MKRLASISLAVTVFCWAARYVLLYRLGYEEDSLLAWRAEDLLSLLGLVFALVLVVTWILALIRKRDRVWTTAMLFGNLLLMALLPILPSADEMVLYGLQERLSHEQNLDELRGFAKDFDQLPALSENDPGTKLYVRDDLAKTDLSTRYSFLSWANGPGITGPAYVSESDGVVKVMWGAVDEGHWGFCVSTNGQKLDLSPRQDTPLRVSDDIIVVGN